MTKFWCNLGFERYQVTEANCEECDRNAEFEEGAYLYCTARKPYEMQIQEALHSWRWYLETLWKSPHFFLVLLGKAIANLMGLTATPMSDGKGHHLIWIKPKKREAQK